MDLNSVLYNISLFRKGAIYEKNHLNEELFNNSASIGLFFTFW